MPTVEPSVRRLVVTTRTETMNWRDLMADDVVLSDEEIQAALESLPGWESKDDWLQRSGCVRRPR